MLGVVIVVLLVWFNINVFLINHKINFLVSAFLRVKQPVQ